MALQKKFQALVESLPFIIVVNLIIVINSILIGIETTNDPFP